MDNPQGNCTNFTRVSGSCDFPNFKGNNSDISESQKTKWINIIDTITKKFEKESEPKYLDLVLGATTSFKASFNDLDNSFILNICPIVCKDFKYDIFIEMLNALPKIKGQMLKLDDYFPLSHNFPNSKLILDKLIHLHNNGVIVRITNRMCGTCHRSLYYLVRHGIEYIVEPEQGLGVQDTEEIKRCFKI
jgi:hypothetical protein